jgi:hypothetical protein
MNAINNFATRRKVKQLNEQHGKKFVDWEQIKKIALFIEASSKINKSEMDKFVESLGKYVSVFYLETRSKTKTYSDWKCITSKDKTISGMPKAAVLKEVAAEKFDLAISACKQHSNFTARIFAQCNSDYKCGASDVYGESPLVIEWKEGADTLVYLKDVLKYVQMIRTGG